MYHKYHTEAIVLESRESGEADKVFALYTRDFGLVYARATSVRSEKSKMRMALQSCCHVRISLVRGRRGWRAAGATHIGGALQVNELRAFARITALALRLVAGEEKNAYLFDSLSYARMSFADTDTMNGTIELVAVARVLYALGYISSEALGTALFTHNAYAVEHLIEAESIRDDLLLSINRALSEAHL
jgi:recombinational DNA repair protein (RecF pathway)